MKFIFLVVFLFISIISFSQPNVIEINIKGYESSKISIGNYYGDQKYIKEELESEKPGVFQYNVTNNPKGVYLIILPDLGNRYFEFIMEVKSFKINIDLSKQGNDAISFSNSEQNELFKKYNKIISDFSTELNKSNTIEAKELLKAQKDEKIEEILEKSQGTTLSILINGMKETEVPENLKIKYEKEGNKDGSYYYMKKHYWDNIEFNSADILYSPIYDMKLNMFFDNWLYENTDTVIQEIKNLIPLISKNKEIFKYTIISLTNKYASSNIVCFDKIYVFMVENFYLNGKAVWVEEAQIEKMRTSVNKLKKNLCGEKATDIILPNKLGIDESLYSIDSKYTILVFWKNQAASIKYIKEIDNILKNYSKEDLKVYAVYIGDKSEITETLKSLGDSWTIVFDNSEGEGFKISYNLLIFPELYVLDENKKIIVKKISPKYIDSIIGKH